MVGQFAIQPDPEALNRMFESARTAHRTRQLAMAEELCQQILELEPRHLPAKALLGLIAGETERLEMGIALMREVVAIDRTSWPAYNALSIMLRQAGQFEDAAEARKSANGLAPDDISGLIELGACYSEARRFHQAEEVFQQVIDREPGNFAALAAMGECLYAQERKKEAADYWHRAHMCQPDTARGHFYLAQAVAVDGRTEEAVRHLEIAIELNPQVAELHVARGDYLQHLGRFTEAEASYLRALELRPIFGSAYAALARGRKLTEADRPHVETMEKHVTDRAATMADRLDLHYALGKAYDDLKAYEQAMRHYDEGNRIAHEFAFVERPPFDPDLCRSLVDDVIATYTKEFFADHQGYGSNSDVPVLIVGMMRSGTTLTEQIISSHSQVAAAGEQLFWMEKATEVGKNLGDDFDFTQLSKWADEYLELLRSFGPNAAKVTEKNPHNFFAIGFIHTVFPNARIIHCRRNPVDNCLSIYVTRNASSPDYAFHKGNIAFMYRQYARVMKHWAKVLPPDRFLEVQYEDMVSDHERIARRIIEFCGLPWEDACLSHERNERTVVTPSIWQVRQPVYKTSVERWRNYEPWIGEFLALLDPDEGPAEA